MRIVCGRSCFGWPPLRCVVRKRFCRLQVGGEYKYCPIFYFRCSLPALGGDCDMVMTSVSGHLTEINFPAHFR